MLLSGWPQWLFSLPAVALTLPSCVSTSNSRTPTCPSRCQRCEPQATSRSANPDAGTEARRPTRSREPAVLHIVDTARRLRPYCTESTKATGHDSRFAACAAERARKRIKVNLSRMIRMRIAFIRSPAVRTRAAAQGPTDTCHRSDNPSAKAARPKPGGKTLWGIPRPH